MEYVLETSGLCKRYRGFAALNGLDMHIPKGAIYGFVGRNGAGKTTLIRLICGLQEPTGGSFTLYGARNTDAKIERSRRRMGAVVETPSIYMDMTAEENIRQQYLVLGIPSEVSPWRWREARTFWCWTSRSTALTPRVLSKCGS